VPGIGSVRISAIRSGLSVIAGSRLLELVVHGAFGDSCRSLKKSYPVLAQPNTIGILSLGDAPKTIGRF
jgi:hypothetical protein